MGTSRKTGFGAAISLAAARRNHEDVTTELFAELLRNESVARCAFLRLLHEAGHAFEDEEAVVHVSTQLTELDEKGGRIRADLIFRTFEPPQAIVVEVKTLSGLSTTRDGTESQPERYRRVFEGLPGKTDVAILAPVRFLGVDPSIPQVTWQRVRDSFDRVRNDNVWIERFIQTLEELNLATDMTIHGVLSVVAYRRFHRSFRQALDAAWPDVLEKAAPEFEKRDRLVLEDGRHDRTGYSFPLRGGPDGAFSFLGMYYGENLDEPEVPILYFFLSSGTEVLAR